MKTRTITLTDRTPVRIAEDAWPLVAEATDNSFAGNDYGRLRQALARNEVDTYSLRVRQHADGRTLVYGVLCGATVWTGTTDHRGGELLPDGSDIPAAIRRVGEECGLPDHVIRECIADLPAEEI